MQVAKPRNNSSRKSRNQTATEFSARSVKDKFSPTMKIHLGIGGSRHAHRGRGAARPLLTRTSTSLEAHANLLSPPKPKNCCNRVADLRIGLRLKPSGNAGSARTASPGYFLPKVIAPLAREETGYATPAVVVHW
jgi:hypothetical protein